jgi:hypothetical protein
MKVKMKKYLPVIIVISTITILYGCANNEIVDACLKGHKYGFFGGLWHGIIAPFDFLAMVFSDNATIYAQNNNGAWYAFGFLIGSGGWGFLGGKGAFWRRRRVV